MMYARTSWFLFVVVTACFCYTAAHYCHQIQNRCVARLGCGMALNNFFIGCDPQINGETTECSPRCKRALISLISSEDQAGLDFIRCQCHGHDKEDCEIKKKRVEVCTTDVLEALKSLNDSSKVISCTLALWLCEAESSCLTALNFFVNKCSSLKRGEKCTEQCNNSLNILYQQQRAQKLKTCNCDDSKLMFDCENIRYQANRLCYNKLTDHRNRSMALSAMFITICVCLLASVKVMSLRSLS